MVRTCGSVSAASLLLAASLLVAVGIPAAAHGQGVTTSSISGRVVDADGAPVADANIELRHAETGAVSLAGSDRSGRFFLPNQRPGGPYTLTVRRIGFAEVRREDLQLRLGQTLHVEVTLSTEPVALPELAVRLEADSRFDPSRMGAETVISQRSLESLPTISRDFLEFAQLSPLVKVDEEGVSVAGSNLRFNNIQVDGALNQDVFGLSPTGVAGGQAGGRIIPLGAIQELEVLIAPFDVRQSGFTGGVVNAVTRQGTNDWEGSAFGFFRNDALVGDLIIDEVSRSAQIENVYGGFTLGGPIVEDRLHFFTAGEFERRRKPPDGFEVGVDDPFRTELQPDSVARFQQLLSGYGVDAGQAGSFQLANDLANLFARVDYRLDDRNSLMVRYNFASADDDPPPNRLPGEAYELSSNGTEISNRNHSIVGQWLGQLGERVSNDLMVNLQLLRDRETPLSNYPRVEVDILSDAGENFRLLRRVRAGADFFAHASELDQDIFQVTNSLTFTAGTHRLLVGGSFERFGIRRLFQPGSLGTYRFDSLADLEANRPRRYDVNIPLTEGDQSVRFSVNQWAGFVQDEWRVSEALNLRFGMRVDIPVVASSPAANPGVAEDFGVDTSALPSGNPLFSPRLGFNLGLGEGRSTQIRGGIGLFTGRPAFAWLANAFQFDGTRTRFLTCERFVQDDLVIESAPSFDPNAPPPTACIDDAGLARETVVINAFDPDYRFPQDLRYTLAIDQRLPLGLVGGIEIVWTEAVNQTFVLDRNLITPLSFEEKTPENGYPDGFGYGTREAFGDNTRDGFDPLRRSGRFGPVVQIENRAENFAYAVSGTLSKRFGDRLAVDAGYAFNRSADTQSLIALDALSNLGFTAIEGDPRNPKTQPSLFDRPHKVVLNVSARVLEELGGTDIGLLYIGQSGAPYSYVYLGDINGDGIPGDGQGLDLTNDNVYVPVGLSDYPTAGVTPLIMESLIAKEPCLEESRGRIIARNACRAPWSNQLDLRVTQHLRLGGARAQLYVDMLNVLNFMNSDWGRVERANPVVQILRIDGRLAGEPTDILLARYQGPIVVSEEGGRSAVRPLIPTVPESQWQAQIGFRLSF